MRRWIDVSVLNQTKMRPLDIKEGERLRTTRQVRNEYTSHIAGNVGCNMRNPHFIGATMPKSVSRSRCNSSGLNSTVSHPTSRAEHCGGFRIQQPTNAVCHVAGRAAVHCPEREEVRALSSPQTHPARHTAYVHRTLDAIWQIKT